MAPSIKFTYFNVKALGESTRLMLKYGGIDFIDNRVEDDAWDEFKPKTPFGQVPLLEENGKVGYQSTAIARYVAKKVKLVGANDWENLEIDAIADTINDLKGKVQTYYYEPDPATKQTRKTTLFQETLPFYLGKFEQIAKKNNGYFAVGKLTWADFFFVGLLDYLNEMTEKNLTDEYPSLKKVVQNVTSIPKVKAWIDTRPKTTI